MEFQDCFLLDLLDDADYELGCVSCRGEWVEAIDESKACVGDLICERVLNAEALLGFD